MTKTITKVDDKEKFMKALKLLKDLDLKEIPLNDKGKEMIKQARKFNKEWRQFMGWDK